MTTTTMLNLTKQERLVLITLSLVIFTGSAANYAVKKFPGLGDIINLIDHDEKLHRINLNTATRQQFMKLPRIGEVTSARIIEYRNAQGGFRRKDQLREVKGIGPKTYERIAPYVHVVNSARKNTAKSD